MYSRLLLVVLASLFLDARTTAQTSSGWVPFSTSSSATSPAPAPVSTPKSAPVAAPIASGGSSDTAGVTSADFEIDGVPYAKVLYLEGIVWIRPPGGTSFHRLEEDEPIANQSVIHTGIEGILDFATGPGMAVRMVPNTTLVIDTLPKPAPASSTVPTVSQVDLRKGTIFSALGREDGAPIDFSVQTPFGTAAARGTMFATSAVEGTAQVSMLHGTVNFETPDHQSSQITAGQSQQITGGAGGKFQMAAQRPMSPANSDTFFNHAGGLLEHASGYGVVRHGLGADVAKEMQRHGYKMPAATMERMQNAGKTYYKSKPVFNHTKVPNARSTTYHPTTNTRSPSGAAYHPEAQKETEKPVRRNPGQGEGSQDKDKNNKGWGQ